MTAGNHYSSKSKVETFGTMKKKEKTEYILEQMRLCLLKKDFVRTQIISKKIHPRVLNEEGFEELKIRFNKLMIQYYLNDRNHLSIATCYWHIYQTEKEEVAKFEVQISLHLISCPSTLSFKYFTPCLPLTTTNNPIFPIA